MKRTILIFSILLFVHAEPVAENPVLISDAKQWEITGAYYQKVALPDSSKLELKSREFLTEEQWQKLADDKWKSKQIELNQQEKTPQICPNCGQEIWP